jgi:hypothetical protein
MFSIQSSVKTCSATMSSLIKTKDSQWLQIEICQEYLTQSCAQNNYCRRAHPMEHVEKQNGKVVACYDSFKGRCTREICKYYHPTSQLMEQLLTKGRNNLAKNSSDGQNFLMPFLAPTEMPTVYPASQLRSAESSLKRSAETSEFSLESLYSTMMCKRLAIERIQLPSLAYQPIFQFPTPSERKFSLKTKSFSADINFKTYASGTLLMLT